MSWWRSRRIKHAIIPGDDLASFTKEQMQGGKHTEYEKALHEEMLAGLALSPPSPVEVRGQEWPFYTCRVILLEVWRWRGRNSKTL